MTITLPEAVGDFIGQCGFTSYNKVEGHFFLAKLPQPNKEVVTRTVQGIADRFESTYEDASIGSVVSLNDNVNITETVYQGEALDVITNSVVSTFESIQANGQEVSSIVVQGGQGNTDSTGTYPSSTADSIIAIAVEDIRPFLLKGFDAEHRALFDTNDRTKPTNQEYIRHLTPEKESRIAKITIPSECINGGGLPSVVEVHYNAIDLSGEVIAAYKDDPDFLTFGNVTAWQQFQNDKNDIQGMSYTVGGLGGKKSWLIVEKTVPDSNTVFTDTSTQTFRNRTLADWLKRPFTDARFIANGGDPTDPNSVIPLPDALEITAPGGIISLPSANFNKPPQDHVMRVNPTGDETLSPFIDVSNCPHTIIQEAISVGRNPRLSAYGRPRGIPNTISPVKKSLSSYHTLSVISPKKEKVPPATGNIDGNHYNQPISRHRTSLRPITFEQFDIIDNVKDNDLNLLLIHPKNRKRSGILNTISTTTNSDSPHVCQVNLLTMKGRVEEIAPNSESNTGGVLIRGKSQLMDITDRIVERDFSLTDGYAIKEIGDLGSPSVSLTMAGLGQGGIDIKPDRTEHSFLPVWKDKVIGADNPSVRNDKQTSTYYASTRALVELPLFPSMFFDVEQRLATSTKKRSPLPSNKSMELVLDATMTAMNRPQMKDYESRNAIDWGAKNKVSALTVNEVLGDFWIRAMRESSSTFTRAASYSGAASDTQVVLGGGNNNADFSHSGSYLLVDSILPFILNEEGGFEGSNTGAYNTTTPGQAFTNIGFVVTVGEGIINEKGIRFHIHKSQIVGTEHRLYFDAFQDFEDNSLNYAGLKAITMAGLPVVMGSWLTNANGIGVGTIGNNNASFSALNASPVGSNSTKSSVAQSFIGPLEKTFALGRTITNGVTDRSGIHLDPNDSNTVLIYDGPTMEGFAFDPANYLYSQDTKPLVPPIECRSGYLSLKGKRSDGLTLDWVRPMKIKLGDIASVGTVSKFENAVDELIRRINQAGHPNAKNLQGGSAFDPPPLFTNSAGQHTVVASNDTGSHMGYLRAFLGQTVESRDGEEGLSIVIHSTVPGASGRNFAVWINNESPYPYRPIQAVGHGGLLATNSRSYQAGAFPVPLPLGMDGETHLPITTFQGGVHGAVSDADNNLRTYEGVGQEFEFNTVSLPQFENGNAIPNYDPESQPTLMVDRKALDILYRIKGTISRENKGLILVDGQHLGEFDDIITGVNGVTPSKVSGVGSCIGLANTQPLDKTLGKKWKDLFYDNTGTLKEVPVKLLNPLVDANGILFFGGGHTGVTFDISDGTDNDYSDFYTHHYSKGPAGNSGFQNLEGVQTSAAVLDFSELKNEDTVNSNTYRGMHHQVNTVVTGALPDAANKLDARNTCVWYLPMSQEELGQPQARKKLAIDTIHGSKVYVNRSDTVALVAGPTADPSCKGVLSNGHTSAFAIALHDKDLVTNNNSNTAQVPSLVPMQGEWVDNTDSQYTLSFFFKPGNTGNWSNQAWGNGPVYHGFINTGATDYKGLGVTIFSKQGSSSGVFSYRVAVMTPHSNGTTVKVSAEITDRPKDEYQHIAITRSPISAQAILYVNGTFVADAPWTLLEPLALDSGTHLPQTIGVGNALGSGLYGKASYMHCVGIDLLAPSSYPGYYHGTKGNGNDDPRYWKGVLSEMAMWNYGMTAQQIANLYNARNTW